MHKYLLLLSILISAHALIFPIQPIQNCQKIQKNTILSSCIQCNQGYKLVKGVCVKCEANDASFQCKESSGFSYGSNSVSQINLNLKYQAVSKIENVIYKPGSAPLFDQPKAKHQNLDEIISAVSQNIPKNQNLSENSNITEEYNYTHFNNTFEQISQNTTESLNISIEDAFNLTNSSQVLNIPQELNRTNINDTFYYEDQNATNSKNTSSQDQDAANVTDSPQVVYVEYKKDFKSQILSPSEILFDEVNLQSSSGIQILNLQKPKFSPIFVLDQKFDKDHLASEPNPAEPLLAQDLCLKWAQISPFIKSCIQCKEGYLLSGFGKDSCKKINSGFKLPSKQPYIDKNCNVINYFAGNSPSDLCSECKQNYIYSRISNKCVAKDPFCQLYEGGACKKCVQNFQLSADKSLCLLKIK